jgi:hypothetical protein
MSNVAIIKALKGAIRKRKASHRKAFTQSELVSYVLEKTDYSYYEIDDVVDDLLLKKKVRYRNADREDYALVIR